jgi:D-serine deaminase-like pyridoxal phosphate-dependent protein
MIGDVTTSASTTATPTLTPAERWRRYQRAFAEIDPPFAFVDLDAMWSNSASLLRLAAGKPIRVASKSLRCRSLLRAILDSDRGFRGLLCFTLPEALWLAESGFENLVVAYPTTDRAALRALTELTARGPQVAPVVMIDSGEHVNLIETAIGAATAPVRVCIDFDASYWLAGDRIKLGPKRTPVHTPAQARELARAIERSPAVRLAGMMCYEGHIAGLGDVVPRNPLKTRVLQRMQAASYAELRERRAAAVAAVGEVTELEFVNAGGTGDLHLVSSEPAMTEATAGSGFYAPTLFDNYSAFTLQPAAMFALPVCRRPRTGIVTALGGGYLASGPGTQDRLPQPYLPEGLRLEKMEGAGEVQTPLIGTAADTLAIGDHVYLRHAKAGELCERFSSLYLVSGETVADEVPTYRGEGKCFL